MSNFLFNYLYTEIDDHLKSYIPYCPNINEISINPLYEKTENYYLYEYK